jgi:hypothetical protein
MVLHIIYTLRMIVLETSSIVSELSEVPKHLLVANIKFQEELFKLEQSGKPLPNRASKFKPPPTVHCKYANREMLVAIMQIVNQELIVMTMAF